MTMRQTIDIPASREVYFKVVVPETVPCGRTEVILDFPTRPAKAEAEEPLPKVTRAQWAQWEEERKHDPVWQELDKPLEHDSSWLPEGLTRETFRVKDVRDIIIKDKYGI